MSLIPPTSSTSYPVSVCRTVGHSHTSEVHRLRSIWPPAPGDPSGWDGRACRNRAIGSSSQGGGIYNNNTLTLTESKVTDNISTLAPGGIFNDGGQVSVDQKTVISGNRPTNCTPSSPPVPNCFG